MTQSQTLSDELCVKLRAVGLPKDVVLPLVNSITISVKAEGPENVVRRLKLIKQAAVSVLANQKPDFTWIAHDSKGPKGPWKPVWRLLQSSSYKHRKRAINAMMVYSSLLAERSEGPSSAQERKFLGSVVQSPERAQKMERIDPSFLSEMKVAGRWLSRTFGKPELTEVPDAVAFATTKNGSDKRGCQKTERQIDTLLSCQAWHPFPSIRKAIGEQLISDYRDLTHPWHRFEDDFKTITPDDIDMPLGVIGFSQEPGWKFRAFAAPNVVMQAALEPLKKQLLSTLSRIPCDFTHDQDSGVERVRCWLEEGSTVFSVDLSDATNNFPLALQDAVAEGYGVTSEYRHLMKLVSRSPFTKMWGDRQPVRWNVGQPLGAGPSFPLFAISHIAFAMVAGKRAGLTYEQSIERFNVLGDDFVTKDAGLHLHYRQLLAEFGIPISEAKCLSSDVLGEFAGKLISNRYVYHGFKYKEISDQSFLPVIRSLGRQAISKHVLSDQQFAYAHLVKEFPEPYGLGFNPKGRTYQDRYEEYLVFREEIEKLKPKTDPVVSESEIRNKFFYGLDKNKLDWKWYFSPSDQSFHVPALVAMPAIDRKKVLEIIRHDALRSYTPVSGDPRPKPLMLKSAKMSMVKAIVSLRTQGVSGPGLENRSDDSPSGPSLDGMCN